MRVCVVVIVNRRDKIYDESVNDESWAISLCVDVGAELKAHWRQLRIQLLGIC